MNVGVGHPCPNVEPPLSKIGSHWKEHVYFATKNCLSLK